MGYVPLRDTALGTELWVWLPDEYADEPGVPVPAEVVAMPFRPPPPIPASANGCGRRGSTPQCEVRDTAV